jgi:hypothetical protein
MRTEQLPFRIALLANGLAMVVLYPLFMLALERPGWVWDYPARNPAMEHMLVAVYVTMGAFLVWAARDPIQAIPLIDFVIVSGAVHGATMAWDALRLPGHEAHLAFGRGDVVGILIAPVTLILTHPRKFYLLRAPRAE